MKRFFSWTATDGSNQSLKGSLVSVTNADVSGQRPLPRNGHPIPIVFLDASEEELRFDLRPSEPNVPVQPKQEEHIAGRFEVATRDDWKRQERESIMRALPQAGGKVSGPPQSCRIAWHAGDYAVFAVEGDGYHSSVWFAEALKLPRPSHTGPAQDLFSPAPSTKQ